MKELVRMEQCPLDFKQMKVRTTGGVCEGGGPETFYTGRFDSEGKMSLLCRNPGSA